MRLLVSFAALAFLAGLALSPTAARAQERLAEEPTTGLSLPATPLAGEHDATAVELNPAGLLFLDGQVLQLVFTGLDEDHARGAGAGFGVFSATAIKLPLLPKLAFGFAVSRLDPPRDAVSPDPGEPLKLSIAQAFELAPGLSFGFTWHHFIEDGGATLDGLDTIDLGLSTRLGSHMAFGAVVRDVAAPTVGGVPLQRRYGLEIVLRPTGTDRLELGLAAELGERRLDFDPRARLSWRITDGLWLRGEVGALTRWHITDPAAATGCNLPGGCASATREHDLRASLGLEVSFGKTGVAAYGTAGKGAGADGRLLGGTAVVRYSSQQVPSVMPSSHHLERIRLEGGMSERDLTLLVLRMRAIERDESARGVVIVFDGLSGGWATLQEIRDHIHRLRKKGKKVFAFLPGGSTREYYVAAACDRIYLDPSGGLTLLGLSSTVTFYKNLFDELGVTAEFEKIDEYKSAPETYTRASSSDEARAMRDWILDSVYDRLVADLAKDRGFTPKKVREIFDGGPYTAKRAEAEGIVDAMATPKEADRLIAQEMGGALPVSEQAAPERPDAWQYPQIAVVFIDGDIVGGESQNVPLLGRRLVGGDTIAGALKWARQNPQVKAVVLRVKSPGGVATASEIMAREVFETRGVKPILVSMGDVAASGGYFAAAGGDVIFAQPSTITGSIGIFAGKFDVSRLLGRLGLTWESSQRGAHAEMNSFLRPYSDEERARLRKAIQYGYERFLDAVSRGRNLTTERVDAVGRGRVWTGEQARERGLVDRHGGIGDALWEAKRLAGYGEGDRVQIVMLPSAPQSLLGQLLKLGGAKETEAPATRLFLPRVVLDRLPASLLVAPDEPQARLPFHLEIE